jgi:hypothetical protein
MRGRAVPLSCHCHACRLDRVHDLLVSGRIDAARLALEEVTRLHQAACCTRRSSIPLPSLRPPAGPEAA